MPRQEMEQTGSGSEILDPPITPYKLDTILRKAERPIHAAICPQDQCYGSLVPVLSNHGPKVGFEG